MTLQDIVSGATPVPLLHIGGDIETLFPLKAPNTLAGRLVQALQSKGHWISRYPDCLNIVYVEGMDADGKPNDNAPNVFNDLRLVLRINRAGKPNLVNEWEGTTEPGRRRTCAMPAPVASSGARRAAIGSSWRSSRTMRDSR